MDKFEALQAGLDKINIIGLSGFALYAYLIEQADQDGNCWPGYDAIMGRTGLSSRPIATAIRLLQATGLVQTKKGFKTFTQFTISLLCKEITATSILIKDDDVNVISLPSKEITKCAIAETTEDDLGPWGALSKAFEQEAGIYFHAPERWKVAIDEMLRAGVEPDDMKAGVEYVRSKKHLTLRGPWSVVNAAIIELGKRKGKNGKEPEEFYDYASGTYQRAEL